MNPWYLPKGSVRGLLAGALVGTVVYLAITGGNIPQAVSTLAGVAVTYYFKTREGSEK